MQLTLILLNVTWDIHLLYKRYMSYCASHWQFFANVQNIVKHMTIFCIFAKSCKCEQKLIRIPKLKSTLWTHACSTHNTHAQVGVYHVHSRTHACGALNTKPPRWSSPTPPLHTLSVRTQRHSQSTTQPPLLHSRAEKKDNAIYRSFFQSKKQRRLIGFMAIVG